MAQPLADDLGMDAGLLERRGMTVPQVVEADFQRLLGLEPPPDAIEVTRPPGTAARGRKHEVRLDVARFAGERLLGLLGAVDAKRSDNDLGQRDAAPRSRRLRPLEQKLAVGLLERLVDGERGPVEVDVRPGSARAIWLKAVWWLTQMMPMFTNVTA